MGKNIKLSAEQKDEIRRLTQLANRRIKAAEKAYRKEGMSVLPSDVVGKYQIKEQWNTKNTPISRSVKFEDQKAYRKQLQYLRQFETVRPGIKEYTKVQQEKTKDSIETALGTDVPDSLTKKVDKMTAPELSKFWKSFSDKASKMGVKYASDSAMNQTLSEFFPEDMQSFTNIRKTG